MKRIFTFLLSMVMIFSCFSVYGALPPQLSAILYNYTGDASFTCSFDNADEVISFIDSVEDDWFYTSGAIDLKSILRSLFDISGKTTVKADISKDFKKIRAFVSSEGKYNVVVNQNLDVAVTPRTSLWVDIDLTDSANPVFDIITFTPMNPKYVKYRVFELVPQEHKGDLRTMIDTIFNPLLTEAISKKCTEILDKYAECEVKGSKCTLTLDNDGAISLFTELGSYLWGTFTGFADSFAIEEGVPDNPFEKLRDMSGLKVLGDKGIKMEYTIAGDHVTSANYSADIEIGIPYIYELISGGKWEFENELTVDFTISGEGSYYDFGTTVIDLPTLTDENSVLYEEMYSEMYYYDYPREYFYSDTEEIPLIEGMAYMPLEETLRTAYGDTLTYTEENGNIIAVCEHFDEFTTLTLTVGSNKVYTDGVEKQITGVVNRDGVVYVDCMMFEEVLNWEISDIEYDVMDKKYEYSGFLSSYFDYMDEGETYEPEYPRYYVSGNAMKVAEPDETIYVPLRHTLEQAYGDTVEIEYNDGQITATCPHFEGFSTLKLSIGSGNVYADDEEYITANAFLDETTTYVDSAVFESVFGWTLYSANYSILTGNSHYSFYTEY